jgi:glycerol-3-phosphate dehydrogenase
MAPQLAAPTRFLVPVVEDGPVPLWKARSGVAAYSALARWMDGRGGRISQAEAERLVPDLAVGRTRGVVVYHDHVTNDPRGSAVLQGAAERGAHVLTHADVVGLRFSAGRLVGADLVDRLGVASFTVSATAVVNAAGPWVDEVRRLESPSAGTSVRLSKGVHLLLRGGDGWSAAVRHRARGAGSFAVPWRGCCCLERRRRVSATRARWPPQSGRREDPGRAARCHAALDRALSSPAGGARVPMSTGGTAHPQGTVISRSPAEWSVVAVAS